LAPPRLGLIKRPEGAVWQVWETVHICKAPHNSKRLAPLRLRSVVRLTVALEGKLLWAHPD